MMTRPRWRRRRHHHTGTIFGNSDGDGVTLYKTVEGDIVSTSLTKSCVLNNDNYDLEHFGGGRVGNKGGKKRKKRRGGYFFTRLLPHRLSHFVLLILLPLLLISLISSFLYQYQYQKYHYLKQHEKDENDHDSAIVYVAGLVRDVSKISEEMVSFLNELRCVHGFNIHVLAERLGDNGSSGSFGKVMKKNGEMKKMVGGQEFSNDGDFDKETSNKCASLHVIEMGGSMVKAATGMTTIETTPLVAEIDPSKILNRIDRIALLRDYQRELLRALFTKHRPSRKWSKDDNISIFDVVIIVDLDVPRPPDVGLLVNKTVHQLQNQNQHQHQHQHQPRQKRGQQEQQHDNNGNNGKYNDDNGPDVVCAAGVTTTSKVHSLTSKELWYYDTFSTVLLPDTFVHPLKRRLWNKYRTGEDRNLIRSNDQWNGNFTQADLMRYLQLKSKSNNDGTVAVRSCFGGLAAYRAVTYFSKECRYRLGDGLGKGVVIDKIVEDDEGAEVVIGSRSNVTSSEEEERLMGYANSKERRPCEHVVFHDCLMRNVHHRNTSIAIDPRLILYWTKDEENKR